MQASNHYKKYHGAIKNNLPARNSTDIAKKVHNTISIYPLATPNTNQPDPTTSLTYPILEETQKELQLFSNPEPLANLPTNSPIPISPDTPAIPYTSPSDGVNISVDINLNNEPHKRRMTKS